MEQNTACTTPSCCGSKATMPVVLGLLAIATAIPAWIMPAMASGPAAAVASEGGTLGRAGVAPETITGLRVVSWDEGLSAATLFEVKRDGDRWIIPSNHAYPADGNTRVTRTASGVLGVAKGRVVTDKPAEHEALGVVDPLEPGAGAKKGFGKRVTLTDATGATALDIVIGNRVDGADGLHYVREVGKPEVVTAKVESDISTKFVDYVEVDPFKIQRDGVRGVAVVDYQLDPDKGQITPGPVIKAARPAGDKDWESANAPEGKRLAKTKVDEVLSELTALRLQGVRPFDLRWLQTRGFYLADQPQAFQLPNALTVQLGGKPYALFGTEGRTDITTRDGLRYSLMFGKIALGDDQDKEAEQKAEEKKDDKPAEGSNRYVAVFVTYDAALDEEAKAEAEKKPEEGKPTKKKLTGKERAAKAQERFQRFFYVIGDSTFKKLRPDVATWWEDMPKEPMAGASGKTVKQWLADNAALPGITTTPSGLQYQTLASGAEGGTKPTTSDSVTVAYKGTLIDGEQFDANENASFAVTGVIKGWTEALQLMKPGDKLKLFVPPELGYGEAGSPPKIGANQILIFEVELKSIAGK
jgi:FKBP-type peptidyl-prolyl cis-trans isomerase